MPQTHVESGEERNTLSSPSNITADEIESAILEHEEVDISTGENTLANQANSVLPPPTRSSPNKQKRKREAKPTTDDSDNESHSSISDSFIDRLRTEILEGAYEAQEMSSKAASEVDDKEETKERLEFGTSGKQIKISDHEADLIRMIGPIDDDEPNTQDFGSEIVLDYEMPSDLDEGSLVKGEAEGEAEQEAEEEEEAKDLEL